MRTSRNTGVIVAGAVVWLAAGCDLGTPAVVYPSPSRLAEVVDVDGDGALDVVAAGPGSYQVLLNDGTGSLAGAPVATDADIVAFAFGDLDGDGAMDRVDLTQGPSSPPSVLLARGDGAGGFGTPEVVVADTAPSARAADVDVFDHDGDGDLDVAVGGLEGPHIFVNDGTGALSSLTIVWAACGGPGSGGYYPVMITEMMHVDLDRDGQLDMVTTGVCERTPTDQRPGLWVFYRDGAQFPRGSTEGVAGGEVPVGLTVADVNEDGHLDVLFGNPGTTSVDVIPGSADGWLDRNRIVIATPSAPEDVAVADIDADGHLDLVVTSVGTAFARVLYGTGTGAFPESHVVATGGDVVGPVAAGDIDVDGSVDLVFGNDDDTADASVAVLPNTLDGRQH